MLLTWKVLAGAVLIAELATISGCAQNRLLSRRDYAEMHDPFMEPSAASSLAAAGSSSEGQGSDVGVVQLGAPKSYGASSTADSTGMVALGGPKPILRASAETSVGASGGVIQAIYPGARNATAEYPGPSLSDFMTSQSRTASADRTSTTETSNADTVFLTDARQSATAQATANPFGATGASPSADVSDFEKFAMAQSQKQTPEMNRPAPVPAFSADLRPQSAGAPSGNEFDDWVSQQSRRLESSTPIITPPHQKPSFDPDPFAFVGGDNAGVQNAAGQNGSGRNAAGATQAAEPLIRDRSGLSREFPGETSKTASSGFEIDTGWKPSHFTRP